MSNFSSLQKKYTTSETFPLMFTVDLQGAEASERLEEVGGQTLQIVVEQRPEECFILLITKVKDKDLDMKICFCGKSCGI
jgi:hypothetical protein